MKKTYSALFIIAILVTAQQVSAESWFQKTFGPNGTAFKMLGASVMNITSIDSVQKKLIDTGSLKGTVTGIADEQTVQAVKTFQAANNLKVDGIVGKETLKVLDPVAAKKIPVVLPASKIPTSTIATPAAVDPWKLKCLGMNGLVPQPQIEVLSPNGGEVFTAGQQITVNWRSCNVQNFPGANTSAVSILLKQQSTGVRYALTPTANPQYGYGGYTQNDGSEVVVLPTLSTFPVTPITYGTDFKVIVTLVAPYPPIEVISGGAIYDESNNLFAINGAQQQVSPILLKPLDSVMLYAGDSESTPLIKAGIFNPSHLVSLKNTSNQTVWVGCNTIGSLIEFTGGVGASGNTNALICTNSLGASLVNNDQIQLAPNQEIILNQTTASLITRNSQAGIATLKSGIKFVNYRLTQNGPTIQANPQSHPQFQSSWVPKMSTAWVLY